MTGFQVILLMLDESVKVPCKPRDPCMLDVKLQGVLLASLGILRVPCVDLKESLEWQGEPTTFSGTC